jgi:putative transferase (TIGR04331 family)
MNKEKTPRFLITTAIQENWVSDQPVLFLGEWCKFYSKKELWSNLDSEVVPYFWDDRKKLYADYEYLRKLYEKSLPLLANKLNQIHKTEHNVRYWQILLGPWLNFFIQILYERWSQIKKAEAEYAISNTFVLDSNSLGYTPANMTTFASFFVSDKWNHFIYSFIISKFSTIKNTISDINDKIPQQIDGDGQSIFRKIWEGLFSKFNRKNKIVIEGLSFDILEYLNLLFRYGYYVRNICNKTYKGPLVTDARLRNWELFENTSNDFESCLNAIIALQIPLCYLEGYSSLMEAKNNLGLPVNPTSIITNNVYYNEAFKCWIAEKAEVNSRLFISQHGGSYGISQWFTNEVHELAISDRFLSWGWTNNQDTKIVPTVMLKKNPFPGRVSFKQKKILLVLGGLPTMVEILC